MDGERFDRFARALAAGATRRGVVRGLVVAAAGVATSVRGAGAACRPDGHRCATASDCCGGLCLDLGPGPDGTGLHRNVCGSCPAGRVPCQGGCILPGQCCSDADCEGGWTCCVGSCVNTDTDPANCGGCGHACPAGQICDANLGPHCACALNGTGCAGSSPACVCPTGTICSNDTCCIASRAFNCKANAECCSGQCLEGAGFTYCA